MPVRLLIKHIRNPAGYLTDYRISGPTIIILLIFSDEESGEQDKYDESFVDDASQIFNTGYPVNCRTSSRLPDIRSSFYNP